MSEIHSYRIGDMEITRITEQVISTLTTDRLFPDSDAESFARHKDWMVPELLSEDGRHALLSIHSWLIRTPHHLMLVDTATGNGKERPFSALFHQLNTPWYERFLATGVTPEDIDYVLLTHLHADHVGWNTVLDDGRWKPTFPNARYVFAKREGDFYTTPASESRRMVFADSVKPVLDAGLADLIEDEGGEYLPGIHFLPTPGHSVGHMAIALESKGETALFIGDVMHHPVQVYHPEWNSVFCGNSSQSRQSRQWLLNYAVNREATLFPAHFAGRSAGKVVAEQEQYLWQPQ